mgnify:CR=1 FL=1
MNAEEPNNTPKPDEGGPSFFRSPMTDGPSYERKTRENDQEDHRMLVFYFLLVVGGLLMVLLLARR